MLKYSPKTRRYSAFFSSVSNSSSMKMLAPYPKSCVFCLTLIFAPGTGLPSASTTLIVAKPLRAFSIPAAVRSFIMFSLSRNGFSIYSSLVIVSAHFHQKIIPCNSVHGIIISLCPADVNSISDRKGLKNESRSLTCIPREPFLGSSRTCPASSRTRT